MKCILFLSLPYILRKGFPGDSDGKESACNTGDPASIPGSGRFPGRENGNPLQPRKSHEPRSLAGYSPWSCKELDTTEQLTLSHILYIEKLSFNPN